MSRKVRLVFAALNAAFAGLFVYIAVLSAANDRSPLLVLAAAALCVFGAVMEFRQARRPPQPPGTAGPGRPEG